MRRTLLIILTLAVFASTAQAQLLFKRPKSVTTTPAFQLWEQSKDSVSETLSQFSLPLSLFVPLGDAGEFNVSGYFAHSRYSGVSQSGRFGALGDLRVDYVNDFWKDRAAYTLSLSLPVGTSKLSADEFFVTEQIASPLLPFRVKHLGEGLNASAALALTGGKELLYGGSARFTYRGSYKPIVDGPDYRPGSSLDLIGEIVSNPNHLNIQAVGTFYTNDVMEDTAIFRDGPQFDLGFIWSPPSGIILHTLSARVILRAKDKRRDSTGTMATEADNSNGTDIRLGYSLARPLSAAWLGRLSLNFKHLGANGYPIDSLRYRGSGNLFGVAFDFTRELKSGVLTLGVTGFFGSAKEGNRLNLSQPDESIDIKGMEFRAGYLWRF